MLRIYDFFVRNMICSKRVNYSHRKDDFSFENMNFPKKVNDLLRKYDLFIQNCGLFEEDCLFASKIKTPSQTFPKTVRSWHRGVT